MERAQIFRGRAARLCSNGPVNRARAYAVKNKKLNCAFELGPEPIPGLTTNRTGA